MPTFITLGQSTGIDFPTNHEAVLRQYLDFHQITDATILPTNSFADALEQVRAGETDYMMINAVHPEASAVVGKYFHEVFIMDSFIAPSHPLAIFTRKDRQPPQSIAVLHPATTDYADLSRWPDKKLCTSKSLLAIAEDLLHGCVDSGLIYREVGERYPDELQLEQELSSPDDCWLILGRTRVSGGKLIACKDSPGLKAIRSSSNSSQ
ncbi:hypothetical protein FE257_004631 [Aspergillus nanangensis]|uniref:Prephenate dehydratase n=1 Tax=Aspergillus nanangensis TaxID=2582783 RepID=A0AAD4D0C0_ASPNN|nr:hypothetical protein FE257_004631 [Aspergillus nanangensis]